MFLRISQNSYENICVGVSFLNRVAGCEPPTLFKKRPRYRRFPVKFAKFLRIHTNGCFYVFSDDREVEEFKNQLPLSVLAFN